MFIHFIIKETRHILRDQRTMLILFGMPVVMMLLFGFAISTDVKNVRTVVVTSVNDHQTQAMVEALGANEYFDIVRCVNTPAEAERLIRRQQADMAVVFCRDFASRSVLAAQGAGSSLPTIGTGDGALLQIITDGADPNMAQLYATYAQQIVSQHLVGSSSQTAMSQPMSLRLALLFNPQMRSCYNYVPGIMGMLLMLICAMMTSISIVREKERGTMEVLLVSPVRPLGIILAKAVPYLVLAFVILLAILGISRFILGVPIACSLWMIFLLSGVYIMVALALGLLISTIARTQFVALLMSAMMLMLPCILLSGMMFPVESMPRILQYVSAIIPPRYFIQAMRKLMLMGVGLDKIAGELTVLVMMAVVLFTAALLNFKKRLE